MQVVSEAERRSKMRALELGIKPACFEVELPIHDEREGIVYVDASLNHDGSALLAVNEEAVQRRVEQEPEFADWIRWNSALSVTENVASVESERRDVVLGFLLGFPRFAVESYVELKRLENKVDGMDLGRLLDLGMFLVEGREELAERFPDDAKRQEVQSEIDLLDASTQDLVMKFYQEVGNTESGVSFDDFVSQHKKKFEDFYRTTFNLSPDDVNGLLQTGVGVDIQDPSRETIMQFRVSESVPDLENKLRRFQEHIFEQYSKA